MKLKLTGLLLLSQAANALTIDKSNYKQHLCDDGIFTQVPDVSVSSGTNVYLDSALENIIMSDYRNYCIQRTHYQEAIENVKTATWRTHKPCAGNVKDFIAPSACAEKQGILYAQACEKLKQDRDSMQSRWNSVVTKRVSCNNM